MQHTNIQSLPPEGVLLWLQHFLSKQLIVGYFQISPEPEIIGYFKSLVQCVGSGVPYSSSHYYILGNDGTCEIIRWAVIQQPENRI